MDDLEQRACIPVPMNMERFNWRASLPYGCQIDHVQRAMSDFIEFLGYLNQTLCARELPRLETMLMPANFSGIVSEFMVSAIAKYCPTLVKNRHHNGHPDLIPADFYPNDAVLHGERGIEVKASRYRSGWQGHNAEQVWLLIFMFESNTPRDSITGTPPRPFEWVASAGAQVNFTDWGISGRGAASRRTPTASLLKSGYDKIMANQIYRLDDSLLSSKGSAS